MPFPLSLQNYSLGGKVRQLAPSGVQVAWPGLLFSLCAFTMIASIVLGGGTHGGFLSDTILQLLAIPVLLFALSSLLDVASINRRAHAEWALLLCLGVVLVPLNQLIPLPPLLWTKLPHRDDIVRMFELVGDPLPWLPISVSPTLTWVSVLSLLAPLAIFIGVLRLGRRERRLLSLVLFGMGIIGALVGLIQVAQGETSPLRFFTITSATEAVGFFANRNHFASFMYIVFIFGAAWMTEVAFRFRPLEAARSSDMASIAVVMACLLALLIIIAAETMARSRAGLALMIVSVFAVIALPISDQRRSFEVTRTKLMVAAATVALLLVIQFGLYQIFHAFAVDPLEDARITLARNTIAAAQAYMPFGSGVGTFVPVYPTFEPAQDAISNTFANRAHDDLLELWLEGGVVSILLLAGFLIWFGLRCRKIWSPAAAHVRPLDVLLARAATIAIPLMIAHSFVDYPLRTGAMLAVFAFCCALLVDPLAATREEKAADFVEDQDDETAFAGAYAVAAPAGYAAAAQNDALALDFAMFERPSASSAAVAEGAARSSRDSGLLGDFALTPTNAESPAEPATGVAEDLNTDLSEVASAFDHFPGFRIPKSKNQTPRSEAEGSLPQIAEQGSDLEGEFTWPAEAQGAKAASEAIDWPKEPRQDQPTRSRAPLSVPATIRNQPPSASAEASGNSNELWGDNIEWPAAWGGGHSANEAAPPAKISARQRLKAAVRQNTMPQGVRKIAPPPRKPAQRHPAQDLLAARGTPPDSERAPRGDAAASPETKHSAGTPELTDEDTQRSNILRNQTTVPPGAAQGSEQSGTPASQSPSEAQSVGNKKADRGILANMLENFKWPEYREDE